MATVTINSFVEDTCVLVAGAFVLVRGPLERNLTQAGWVGAVCGVFGASEPVFPGDRFPYAPHTLACSFATLLAGPRAGAIAAFGTTLAALSLLPLSQAEIILGQTLISVAVVGLFRRFREEFWGVPASVAGQLLGIGLAQSVGNHSPQTLTSLYTVLANTFGLILLLVVARDARLRAEAERHRHEIDEVRRVAAEAKLAMLRSRIQPHFLFNALNSIAALCVISPERASKATIQLGALMRRSLEIDFGRCISLREELATVSGYLSIEQERFGDRIKVRMEVDGCREVQVPAFAIQILVENAVLHGISQKTGGGEIAILARPRKHGWTICVADDGEGIKFNAAEQGTPHGLMILRDQLRAMYGVNARMHLMSRASGGTIAAFHIPPPPPTPARQKK